MRRPRTRPPPTTPGGGRPELRPGAAVSCVRRLDVGSPIDFAGKGTPVSSASNRVDPHRSRSRRIDRSPWCWPWPIANRSSTSTRRRRGIFDPAKGSYTRSCGSDDLDAALLVLPLLGIDDIESRRVRGTIDAIRAELSAGGPLLYRYPPGRDGLPGTEGAFLPCSFWLVQALARTGRRPEAVALFQTLLEHASPLGLYAEEMDPATGAHLGNYPQTLTHAALIQAALAIRDADRTSEPSTR